MGKRFLSIWLPYLKTDWIESGRPELRQQPLVVAAPQHGRLVITASNMVAAANGIHKPMVVADARAIQHSLQVINDKPGIAQKLLKKLAQSCIRFSPFVAIEGNDGLFLDITGCAHLWNGEENYLKALIRHFLAKGYHVRTAIADTPGAAWAISRFGKKHAIISPNEHGSAILSLPPAALRIDREIIQRLHKVGLSTIRHFIGMPRPSLRRRFGTQLINRIEQATGKKEELLLSIIPIIPHQERLPALEPILTRTGIDIALNELLSALTQRLLTTGHGIREARFTWHRTDGTTGQLEIGTNRATTNTSHLFRLFENKLDTIDPSPGIELFTLDSPKTERVNPIQEKIWENTGGLDDQKLAELLDRYESRFGRGHLHRFLPAAHHWPERAITSTNSLLEAAPVSWNNTSRPRPVQLLKTPERIEVTAPIPDYPPMLFRYKDRLHKIVKADGPERIEQEWWISQGEHRDYYQVEDEAGSRYWLFRLGHYTGDKSHQWFLHGFFA